ncbi:hypothetical protein, partial [uncultured Fibrobacter sp.]|uniref:hypothetical protein n=1 Tax=uncultured Fibrobacter sp. TaxID=261512 RepID=UPI0025DAF478
MAIFMDFLSMCQVGIFKVQILQVRITVQFPARSACEQRNTNNIENSSLPRDSRGRHKKEKAPPDVLRQAGR